MVKLFRMDFRMEAQPQTSDSWFHQVLNATLDGRGRFFIPSLYRKEVPNHILNGKLWITPELNSHLIVRPDVIFHSHIESVKQLLIPMNQKEGYIRSMNAISQQVNIDAQNRIALADLPKKTLGFSESNPRQEIVLVGAGTSFEIWPRERFEGEESLIETVSRLHQELGKVVAPGYSG